MEDLKPGDLIEINRVVYKHWAIYLGDGYIIHFTVDEESKLNQLTACEGFIRKDTFEKVVGKSQWRKNNILDNEYEPRSPAEFLQYAEKLVGQKMVYSLKDNNCEHFVTFIRYGNPESRQVKKLIEKLAVAGVIAAGVLLGVAVLRAVWKSGDSKDHSEPSQRKIPFTQ